MSFVVQITEANAEKMKRTVLSLIILFSMIFFIQTCEGIAMKLLEGYRAQCYLFLIFVVDSQRRLNNILEKLQNSVKQI